jgi:hypothetical protein
MRADVDFGLRVHRRVRVPFVGQPFLDDGFRVLERRLVEPVAVAELRTSSSPHLICDFFWQRFDPDHCDVSIECRRTFVDDDLDPFDEVTYSALLRSFFQELVLDAPVGDRHPLRLVLADDTSAIAPAPEQRRSTSPPETRIDARRVFLCVYVDRARLPVDGRDVASGSQDVTRAFVTLQAAQIGKRRSVEERRDAQRSSVPGRDPRRPRAVGGHETIDVDHIERGLIAHEHEDRIARCAFRPDDAAPDRRRHALGPIAVHNGLDVRASKRRRNRISVRPKHDNHAIAGGSAGPVGDDPNEGAAAERQELFGAPEAPGWARREDDGGDGHALTPPRLRDRGSAPAAGKGSWPGRA